MKAKSFRKYIDKRLNKSEIAKIETELYLEFLESLPEDVSKEIIKN